MPWYWIPHESLAHWITDAEVERATRERDMLTPISSGCGYLSRSVFVPVDGELPEGFVCRRCALVLERRNREGM